LNLPWRRALAAAQKLAVPGVELAAVGDFAPAQLSQTGRRELRHLLRSHNLELAALLCPLRRGLDVAQNQEPRIDLIKEVLSLSFDLGPRCVVIEAGKVPEKEDDARAPLLKEALLALGRHGDRVGAALALQTGLESGAALANYLDRFDTGSLGACYNPGNLLMSGHDPYTSARALGRRILYSHASDARYSSASAGARPVPAGHGDIDWLQLLGTLEEIGYRGWLTIPHEAGADAAAGVAFLKRLLV
jgi:L-ribulose-5-phosphate 3-epimerase